MISFCNVVFRTEKTVALLGLHPAKQDYITERFLLRKQIQSVLDEFHCAKHLAFGAGAGSLPLAEMFVVIASFELHCYARVARFRLRGMRCRVAVVMYVEICNVHITANSTPLQGAKKDNSRPLDCCCFFWCR